MQGQQGFANYRNEITAQLSSVYYESLPGTGWSLGITFIQEEMPISAQSWRHHYIWILIAVVLALLLLSLLISEAYTGVIRRIWAYSVASSSILILGIFALWMLVYQTSTLEYERGVTVVDKAGLNKFLDSVNRKAASNNEQLPITMPTGMYVRSLSFPTPMQVEFAADVWQKYDTQKQGLTPGITFPQAIKMTITEVYREKEGTVETVGWTVQGLLSQDFDYSRYPFDIKNVEIVMEYKDKTKNVLLVPDFESYRLINPTTKPGLDEQVKVLGFTARKSIYSFKTERPKVNFGIEETQANRISLSFNCALKRNLIDALVVFMLPLIVILVGLYAASWLTVENPENTVPYRPLAAYTAVVFALVLLHRTFREKLPSGDIIYLEYFFLFAYLIIVGLMLNALMIFSKTSLGQRALAVAYWLRFLYWPLEILAWFITTVVIFYN